MKNFYHKDYYELARFDKPAGALLLMWPCWFGVILASQNQESVKTLLYLSLFAIGSFLMRGAGCVVNDIFDREIDKQVERTKNRPLSSGKLKLKQAYILLGLLICAGFSIWLFLNNSAKIISLVGMGMMCIYPLMKRITKYPQVFLGLTFNIGALVGYAVISGSVSFPAFMLYWGCVFWTIAYDTIYAHQDIKDDIKAGVKSTAITFGKYNKIIIAACFFLFIKLTIYAFFPKGYDYIDLFFLAPAILQIIWQIFAVDLNNEKDCMEKFKGNAYITGVLVFLGVVFI